jgi:hypothetical protein
MSLPPSKTARVRLESVPVAEPTDVEGCDYCSANEVAEGSLAAAGP